MTWNGMIDQLAHSLDKGSAPGKGGGAGGQHSLRAGRWLVWGISALVLLWAVNGLWQGLSGLRGAPGAPVLAASTGSTGSTGGSTTSNGAGVSGSAGWVEGSGREYEQALARELESLLSQIDGAGRVRVSVSLERGPIYVFGQNTTSDSRTTDEKDSSGGSRTVVETTATRQTVILRDDGYGERPLIAEEQRPTVAGVLVLAEGAGTSRVRMDIMRAVQALFPLAAHKITVLPMGR